MPTPRLVLLAVAALATTALAAACSSNSSPAPAANSRATIVAVGAENQYANVIGQVGGKYVHVSPIESNPATDPHTFEASASVAQLISSAGLVVQNGLGYDAYMNKIEAAAPNASRKVIDVQHLLRLPDSTPNPHLWYKPTTMPAVAKASPRIRRTSPLRPPPSTAPCSPGTACSRRSRRATRGRR
jgi:zinc/manganese transport system substrate-binding protein